MVVDFEVTFDESVSEDQACSVLKNVVKDGKLGSFNVDSASVECIAPTAEPETKEPTKGDYPLAYHASSDRYQRTPKVFTTHRTTQETKWVM